MRCYLITTALSLVLAGLARADHSDDTLRYYVSKSELCVGGTITSEPTGHISEAGVVNYGCDFAVSEVLAGELKDKTIHVNIIRHEIAATDRLPDLKKGAKCILFLKPEPRSVPPWATVDFWFGYQSYSSALARAIKRVAAAERKDDDGTATTLAKQPDSKSIARTAELVGSWLMTLPAGGTAAVVIRAEGEKRLHLETANRFTGMYELRDGRLVIVMAGDPAEVGFEWEVRGADEIVLVAQRAGLGIDYVGATLTRLKYDSGAAKAPADRPAPKKADRLPSLAGTWLMTMPRGAKREITIRPEGEKQFHLENAVRFSGLYELRGSRLVMVKPVDAAETGFQWQIRGPNILILVAQREGLGSDYRGATLTRLKDKTALKDDAKGSDGASGDPEPEGPAEGSTTVKVAAGWAPTAIDGGFMFRDAGEFQAYVAQAGTIAGGTLAAWDGGRGTLKVEKLYRGEGKPDSLGLSYTGGTVAAKAGEKVLVLLTAEKDGKLHSYCAASGLFRHSDALASLVEKAVERTALPDDGISAEEAGAARALQQIKLAHRLRKEPAYRAPVQYCLLLLGREAKTRLWLASDGTTMYVDRNGNGDLTDLGEAVPYKDGFASLMTDSFPGQAGDGPHTHLHIAVRQRDWEKSTGGYWAVRTDVGRTFHMYAMVHKFARKPQDAPVVHLGGPLRMGLNHLYGGALVRGRETELEAYAACHYPGVERAFVDVDRRCPTDVHPFAEIRLPGTGGAEPPTLQVSLTKRC